MSTKKKLLISLCSLCLVAAVVVIGVFAFATQTFTINNRVSFTAKDVQADVAVFGINEAKGSEQDNDFRFYSFADGSNQLYDENNESFVNNLGNPTDGEYDVGLSWSINASANSNLNTTHTLPDQDFRTEDGYLCDVGLFIWVVNKGNKDFTVTMTDSYLENLKNIDNVTITVKYFKTTGFNAVFEGGLGAWPTSGATEISNGATIGLGEGVLVKVIYKLNDVGLDADVTQSHQFVLEGVTE